MSTVREHVQMPCPPWCTTDHARIDAAVDPLNDLRSHHVDLLVIPNPAAGPNEEIRVTLSTTDDLTAGRREEVGVTVTTAEDMTEQLVSYLVIGLVSAGAAAASWSRWYAPDHVHAPDPAAAAGFPEGAAWFADDEADGTVPCAGCGAELVWQHRPVGVGEPEERCPGVIERRIEYGYGWVRV